MRDDCAFCAMLTRTRLLVILLRLFGATALFALPAVFMPFSWMMELHQWLGVGEMPTAPVVEYLARSVSAFYAFFGGLCLVIAGDPDRHRPVIRFLGIALALMGTVITGVDWFAGMPLWWTVIEGPRWIVVGAVIFWLAGAERPKD